MTANTKEALEAGDAPAGTWVSVGHPAVAEVTASLGYDFLLFDMEHTEMGLETVADMVRAVESTGTETDVIVRVPANDPVWLKRVLDVGIDGVMVPSVETRPEAERLVDATRFPPDGSRGIASVRAADYGETLDDYVEDDGSLLRIAQIESARGVDDAERIAAVDGIDALFVGKLDLSASLGLFGERESTAFREAVDGLLDAVAGVPIGALTVDPDRIREHVEWGFDYLVVGKDTTTLASAGKRALDRYERASRDRSE